MFLVTFDIIVAVIICHLAALGSGYIPVVTVEIVVAVTELLCYLLITADKMSLSSLQPHIFSALDICLQGEFVIIISLLCVTHVTCHTVTLSHCHTESHWRAQLGVPMLTD